MKRRKRLSRTADRPYNVRAFERELPAFLAREGVTRSWAASAMREVFSHLATNKWFAANISDPAIEVDHGMVRRLRFTLQRCWPDSGLYDVATFEYRFNPSRKYAHRVEIK